MITFKEYFSLLNENPTIIKYNNKNLTIEDAAITFIISLDDFYAFQTLSEKIPTLLHFDDQLKIIETPPLTNKKQEMYHEELGAIFGLDLGMQTEDMYIRGRLWIDPQDSSRTLTSMWASKDQFNPLKRYFELCIKTIVRNATEFAYEFDNQRAIDFAKTKDNNILPPTEQEKLKKKRAELIAQWHFTPSGPQRNIIKLQVSDINKKLGIKDEPFEYTKITKSVEPSWKRRDGD